MNNSFTFLFPGQGSQFKGMSKNLLNSYKVSKDYYLEAQKILGYDILEISTEDPLGNLNQTEFTQPAIFINSIIKNKILQNKNYIPIAVAGHSLGEYSALVSCNVLSFKDALRIIKIRASEMQKSGEKNPGGMLAVLGATKEQIDHLCSNAEMLVPANYNSDQQIVLSGSKESIENAIKESKEIGLRKVIPLKTSGAFHSPLMKSSRNSLSKVIKSIEFKNAKMPIYQNTHPYPEKSGEIIKKNLLDQLENPVYWNDTIKNMMKKNLNNFLEVGPGNVLSKLVKKINPKSETITFNTLSLSHD